MLDYSDTSISGVKILTFAISENHNDRPII